MGTGARADKPKPYFPVRLIIRADNTTAPLMTDCMTKNLEKLEGVFVVQDKAAAWNIYLNVMPIQDTKGLKGYVVSTVIADGYPANTLEALPEEDFKNADVAQTVRRLAKGQVTINDHLVQTGAPEDLPKICSHLVSYFDVTYLIPPREDIHDFDTRDLLK